MLNGLECKIASSTSKVVHLAINPEFLVLFSCYHFAQVANMSCHGQTQHCAMVGVRAGIICPGHRGHFLP